MESQLLDVGQVPLSSLVSAEVIPDGIEELRSTRKKRKPKSRPKAKQDNRRKTWSKGINAKERQDLLRADGFARVIRWPLTTTLDFHPVHLDKYPTVDLDKFFQLLRTQISTWCKRKKIGGSYWVWTRENYEGERREHLHMVMYLPPRFRADLEAYIRRLRPGGPDLVRIGSRTTGRNLENGFWSDGLNYRMKQLRGDAVGKPGPTRLRYETKSRHDGARVAPVYGKRCGVSKALEAEAEERWQASKG